MQDLRDPVVSKHSELADHWTSFSGKDGVWKGWRGGVKCSPSFGDEDLGALPEAHLCPLVLELVAERGERLDDHFNQIEGRTVSVVSSLEFGQKVLVGASERLPVQALEM